MNGFPSSLVLQKRLFDIADTSGEVFCWLEAIGILVGLSVFSMIMFELVIRSAMVDPLWSSVFE